MSLESDESFAQERGSKKVMRGLGIAGVLGLVVGGLLLGLSFFKATSNDASAVPMDQLVADFDAIAAATPFERSWGDDVGTKEDWSLADDGCIQVLRTDSLGTRGTDRVCSPDSYGAPAAVFGRLQQLVVTQSFDTATLEGGGDAEESAQLDYGMVELNSANLTVILWGLFGVPLLFAVAALVYLKVRPHADRPQRTIDPGGADASAVQPLPGDPPPRSETVSPSPGMARAAGAWVGRRSPAGTPTRRLVAGAVALALIVGVAYWMRQGGELTLDSTCAEYSARPAEERYDAAIRLSREAEADGPGNPLWFGQTDYRCGFDQELPLRDVYTP